MIGWEKLLKLWAFVRITIRIPLWIADVIQWNLSKVDTYGTEVFVCIKEVSVLETFELEIS